VKLIQVCYFLALSFFFVSPEYQGKGVGSLLMEWGLKKADDLGAKLWLTSTPQALSIYERFGWKTVERYDIDLGNYGGEGIYTRAWMLREPKTARRELRTRYRN
jgi:GNAT superfamily N-acetyltransferase